MLTFSEQDVLEVPNCHYVFVHENHPVVNLLRINKHVVGVDIDDQPRYACCLQWQLLCICAPQKDA